MSEYQRALSALAVLFAKDCQFSLATANDNMPSVRIVDTFYDDGSFYLVTYSKSRKVKEIEGNKNVALCSKLHSFSGAAYNIGHPLKHENSEVRAKLIEAFKTWYFEHNDEKDPAMCYVRIDLQKGFFYSEKLGYKVDFVEKNAAIVPFDFEPVVLP